MSDDMHDGQNLYFGPVFPWQLGAWNNLVGRYERLPHGLLFSGMQGIGKREFVWHFVAWLLCDNRGNNVEGACGHCQSCQWLSSGTHPDLMVLPLSSMPLSSSSTVTTDNNASKVSKKSPNKTKATAQSKSQSKTQSKNATSSTGSAKTTIKVDDIRELQPFISQGSTGRRVCVIDDADTMTIAAANALLKTLEEPREGIHLLLITDKPTKLLPTIKSRVQSVPIDKLDSDSIRDYLNNIIKTSGLIEYKDDVSLNTQIEQSLKLANGAPLAAQAMLSSEWYQKREIWIKTWLALRVGKRSSIVASDYWQSHLALDDFLKLSEFMLMDFNRLVLGIKPLQQDLELQSYESIKALKVANIQHVMVAIEDAKRACQQNVQDKMAFDKLLATIASL